ncbi:cytochrome bd-type quinol oxidase subunit 1 [Anopheles sinensis]|uniref:Cytochrome bd-type quinol oxidase subunit 1 n=1 Tax=Anopheles sinensis TaxID=74873 RepID=A0A084VU10_ANOSI|nr:cytochrome bd-type quinol oxidase subunit 1 [Anopheles sinensis]
MFSNVHPAQRQVTLTASQQPAGSQPISGDGAAANDTRKREGGRKNQVTGQNRASTSERERVGDETENVNYPIKTISNSGWTSSSLGS